MATEAPAPALEAWTAIVAAYQSVLHDLVAVLEREARIDSGVFSALAYLDRAAPPHRLPMSDVQRLMHPRYSQPGFSRLVSRMEQDGLVRRTPDPDDGRAVVLVSTRAGQARYTRANAVYTATVKAWLGGPLTAEQCHMLSVLLAPVGAPDGAPAGSDGPEARDVGP